MEEQGCAPLFWSTGEYGSKVGTGIQTIAVNTCSR